MAEPHLANIMACVEARFSARPGVRFFGTIYRNIGIFRYYNLVCEDAMNTHTISPDLCELWKKADDRAHRRAHAGEFERPCRVRPERPAGPARCGGVDAQRTAHRETRLYHLSFRKPRPAGVREVSRGGLHERRQRRRRHAGLRGSRSAGRPWQEDDLAGAASAHRSRVRWCCWGRCSAGSSIRPSSGCRPSSGAGLVFAGITDTCGMGMILARMPWNQVDRKPASRKCCAQRRRSAHETAHRRWRGWWSFRSRSCPSPLGRRRDRPVRAWAGRVVRQLRPAVLRRRRDRRTGEAARHHAGAAA